MNRLLRNSILLSIALISFLMHYRHFSKDLISIHVWRQTQTQSTIDNFYKEDMNILNPRRNDRGDTDGIFRMEFPLMQWLVAGLYKIFGQHLIISRIFMFVTGLFTILGLYWLLFGLFRNETLALMGAWAFNFSPAFFYYTINPLPDNFALCCSVWGLAFFFNWLRTRQTASLLLSGLFLSIGALCKLPFIVYFIVPVIYFSKAIMKQGVSKKLLLQAAYALGFGLLPLAWYAFVIPGWHGNIIVKGMMDNRDSFSTILDYMQHNLISTLPELLLNYGSLLFFLSGFYFLFRNKAYKDSRFPLILGLSLMVLFYFFFEINAIAKIHDYYLFPFYPLLFMLVAYGAYHLFIAQKPFLRYLTAGLLFLLPLACHLRMQSRWDTVDPGFNKDLLIYKTELRKAVPDDALVVAGNDQSHYIFFYYIDKKGWAFDHDRLSAQQLQSMIEKGATYLYSDSRTIDNDSNVAALIDDTVIKKGSVRVYRLKRPSH